MMFAVILSSAQLWCARAPVLNACLYNSYSSLAQHLQLFPGRQCSSSSTTDTPPGNLAAILTADHGSVLAHSCSPAQHLHHQLLSGRQCSSSSSSTLPAATSAPDPPPPGKLEAIIREQITAAHTLEDLEAVVEEWGSSFNYIHTSVAIINVNRLLNSQQQQPGASQLLQRLLSMWRLQLQLADAQACAQMLGICIRIGRRRVDSAIWDSSWQAFMQHCQQACVKTAAPGVKPQELSDALLACAKLHKQPTADELQLLVQLLLHPDVIGTASVQAIANTIWALGILRQLPGWQGGVTKQQVQLLLGEQQVIQLGMEGTPQQICIVVLSLARMVVGKKPRLSKAFAKTTAEQLLDAAVQRELRDWTAQDIANGMWVCGELQLSGSGFPPAAVAAAPNWLPQATATHLHQALLGCLRLQLSDAAFMEQLLQQGLQVCKQLYAAKARQGSKASRHAAQRHLDSLAGWCGLAVAEFDMQQLAGAARNVVAASGVGHQRTSHRFNLRRLWVFHVWLLRHRLLDGKGLTKLVTEQQLQQGAQEAAKHGRK